MFEMIPIKMGSVEDCCLYKVRFYRSFLRSRLHKIWAVIAILMTIPVWAGFFGVVAALLVLLVALPTYGALMLLTRCPKCNNQVLGIGGWPPRYAIYVFPTNVPEKCPFCGHPVEPEPENKIQAQTAPPSH